MAIYGLYTFSRDPDVNKAECIKFFSAVLGRTLGSVDEVERALSDVYINGRSLAGVDVEEAANTLRESLDVQSHNVAMIKTQDGFEGIKPDNYVKMRDINDTSALTDDEIQQKHERDAKFIEDINDFDLDFVTDNTIISVRDNQDNFEYIKNVTGMDDLNENNIKTALESIYINGLNLSDRLGPEAKLDDYANEVRNALSPESGSFVAVMKKNSITAKPRAVLPTEADNEKIVNTLGFVKSFKESISNEAELTKAEITGIRDRDAKLFFESLFETPDPTIGAGQDLRKEEIHENEYTNEQLRTIDPSKLNHKNYCSVVAKLFDCPLHDFLTRRSPDDLCYAYMLTKIDPRTNKNFTLDDILTDNSEFMNQQKREIGREFCQVFQRIKSPGNKELEDQLNVDNYNNVIYPALYKMTEQMLKTKITLGDVNSRDGVYAARLTSTKVTIAQDILQQIEKQGNLKPIVNSMNAVVTPVKSILDDRLTYLTTNIYLTDDVSAPIKNPMTAYAHKMASAYQAVMESIGQDLFNNVALGAMGMETADLGSKMIGNVANASILLPNEEIQKFLDGQPNALTDTINSETFREPVNKYKDTLSKSRDIPDSDIMSNAVTTAVTINTNPTVSSDDIARGISGAPNPHKSKAGDPIEVAGSVSNTERCEGACEGLLSYITGCPITSITDKKLFRAALEKVYINSQSAAEYFNITDDPDLSKMREIEKQVSEMVQNSIDNKGSQFISVRTSVNNYKAVQIQERKLYPVSENSRAKKERYTDKAKYEADVKKFEKELADYKAYLAANEKHKAGNEIGEAYAALLSGTANNNELKKCTDLIQSAGLKPPGHYVDIDKALSLSKENDHEGFICAFTGAKNAAEALAMADRIIIDGKRVSDMDSFKKAADDNVKAEILSDALRQSLEKNLGLDNKNNSWIRPIMLLDEKGEPQPVRFFANEPEMPQKVEKLSGFSRLIASKEKKDAEDKAYEQYLKDMENYEIKKKEAQSRNKRIDEYNVEADALKYEMVKRNMGIVPTVRQTSLNALSSQSSASNNPPALTPPINTNQRTMNQPTINAPSV